MGKHSPSPCTAFRGSLLLRVLEVAAKLAVEGKLVVVLAHTWRQLAKLRNGGLLVSLPHQLVLVPPRKYLENLNTRNCKP